MKNNNDLEMVFIDKLIAEFLKNVDEYRNEESPLYNNFKKLIYVGGYIIFYASKQGVNFDNYLKLVDTMANIMQFELKENYNDSLYSLLDESLIWKMKQGVKNE